MATRCFKPIFGKRIRVSKMNSCCQPVTGGDCAEIVTDGFISLSLSSETEDGAEVITRKASGAIASTRHAASQTTSACSLGKQRARCARASSTPAINERSTGTIGRVQWATPTHVSASRRPVLPGHLQCRPHGVSTTVPHRTPRVCSA